ncbi:MAG: type II toxin-antitoxin system HipA family toxin [Patulibacter sp.]|nr:type II toxin-antitoxin system HipA family toxin [Patulibacter sp.]
MPVELATVSLWGTDVGAVAIADGEQYATFQYARDFVPSGIEISPITMPLRIDPYVFPKLGLDAFHGLPGLLADALPDRYGTELVNAWLAREGRTPDSINVVERLCYQGTRAMGALEFRPAIDRGLERSMAIEIASLVALAGEVVGDRQALRTRLEDGREDRALREILAVGTSAGGARAKAVIAWNPGTGEVRSGQVAAGPGFEQWLIKFDGVTGSGDHGIADPQGYCAIEYAYALMARAAGVEMAACRLLEEGGRRHFMTRRFDRTDDGDKLHAQTLGGIAHLDYNQADVHRYEQAFLVMHQLDLPAAQREQQFRRMVFNVVARNQDDHVKNIGFLMDRSGTWRLSPAYDVTYAYRPGGRWTSRHQMSINGKRDDFAVADLREVARMARIRRSVVDDMLAEVTDAVRRWPSFADEAGVTPEHIARVTPALRLDLSRR